MTDLDILHAAILADPADDLPRLAYADALEERGGGGDDARAGFIRASVLAARAEAEDRPPPGSPVQRAFRRAMRLADWDSKAVAPSVVATWCPALAPLAPAWLSLWLSFARDPGVMVAVLAGNREAFWRRGFLDELHCPTAFWHAHGPRLVREHPIRVVGLTNMRITPSRDGSAWLNTKSKWLANSLDGLCHDSFKAAVDAVSRACLAWAEATPPRRPKASPSRPRATASAAGPAAAPATNPTGRSGA